jgi:hypothetical protein
MAAGLRETVRHFRDAIGFYSRLEPVRARHVSARAESSAQVAPAEHDRSYGGAPLVIDAGTLPVQAPRPPPAAPERAPPRRLIRVPGRIRVG